MLTMMLVVVVVVVISFSGRLLQFVNSAMKGQSIHDTHDSLSNHRFAVFTYILCAILVINSFFITPNDYANILLVPQIIRDMRRPSAHFVDGGRFRFRFAQVLVNAVALLAIAGGLAAYFRGESGTNYFHYSLWVL
jgi:hypothetical protein